jgi:hypothetical protein
MAKGNVSMGNEMSAEIAALLEVLQERCTADFEVKLTDWRRIFATDGLSTRQLPQWMLRSI